MSAGEPESPPKKIARPGEPGTSGFGKREDTYTADTAAQDLARGGKP